MRLVETNDYKITVEETLTGYIATFWDKTMELEVDRHVEEFETYGGAVDCAFEFLAEVNNLKVINE
jgi:hypothetical protein